MKLWENDKDDLNPCFHLSVNMSKYCSVTGCFSVFVFLTILRFGITHNDLYILRMAYLCEQVFSLKERMLFVFS